jgi:hypothetical protein
VCRLAYRNGVTTAITAPSGDGFLQGVSTAFSAGSPNALARGAIIQQETALHITISLSLAPSVSTQIAALRSQLFESNLEHWVRVRKVCFNLSCLLHNNFSILINSSLSSSSLQGDIPLVVNVDSADIMATLVNLKREFEDITWKKLRLTFSGATEAHLLAEEIAKADISVILTSPRTYPFNWEQRRM